MRRSRVAGTAVVVILALAVGAAAFASRRAIPRLATRLEPDTVVGRLVPGAFNNRAIDYHGRRYFYKVFLPHNYTRARRWPVIFSLHGGKNRGSDNLLQTREGLGIVVKEQRATFPAVAIFPQIPAGARGVDFIPVDCAILDRDMKLLNGDPDRVYLTGVSFGGFTAYQIAYMYPERFAALVPVASAIDMSVLTGQRIDAPRDSVYAVVARRIRNIPLWIFQGEHDEEIGPEGARLIAKTFADSGLNVKYSEFKGATHNIFRSSVPHARAHALAPRATTQARDALVHRGSHGRSP